MTTDRTLPMDEVDEFYNGNVERSDVYIDKFGSNDNVKIGGLVGCSEEQDCDLWMY